MTQGRDGARCRYYFMELGWWNFLVCVAPGTKNNSDTFQLVFKGSGLVYILQLSTKTLSNSKYFFLIIRGLLALWWRNKIQLHNTLPTRKANNVFFSIIKANNNMILASLKAFSFFSTLVFIPGSKSIILISSTSGLGLRRRRRTCCQWRALR